MITIADILSFLDAEQISYTFQGDSACELNGFSSLGNYRMGTFTWIKKQESIPENMNLSQIALVIASENVSVDTISNVIQTKESKRAFFAMIEHFYDEPEERPAIGQFTYIGPKVKLGKDVRIGHNCTLDGDITIGDHTVIWNNVTIINRVSIGAYCEIQSGVIIGHTSLAFTENEHHEKTYIKHHGGVQIGDHVYVAKGTVIDRGTIDDTVVEAWCALDNKTVIAHNCRVGRGSTLTMQCVLGGSTQIGQGCYLSHATAREQTHIGDGATVGMGSIVTRNVDAGQTVVGYPARPFLPGKK